MHCWSSIACWINPRCDSCTLLTSSITVSRDSSQDLIHLVKIISFLVSSHMFKFQYVLLSFFCFMTPWTLVRIDSIFDFWCPVLSRPCILLDVLIRAIRSQTWSPSNRYYPMWRGPNHTSPADTFDVLRPVSLIGSGGECEMWLLPHPQIYLLPSSQ
jgi:hypothetical protein